MKNVDEIIEMAWCDKKSFDDIQALTCLLESETVRLMRPNLNSCSFRLQYKRFSRRKDKQIGVVE